MSARSTAIGERHPWMGKMSRFCTSRPFTVMGVAGVIALVNAPGAFMLIPAAVVTTDPNKDSDSYKAREKVQKHFPELADDATFVVTIALKGKKKKYSRTSLLDTGSEEPGCGYGDVECMHRSLHSGVWPSLLQGVRSSLVSTTNTVQYERQTKRYGGRAIAPILEVDGLTEFAFAFNKSLSNHKRIIAYESYPTLAATGVKNDNLINKQGSATQISFKIKDSSLDMDAQDFYGDVHNIAERLVRKHLPEKDINWGVSSASGIVSTAVKDAEKSSLMMDVTSLPLAGFVFYYVLKSGRLLLVPATTMGISITISFGIMYLVSTSADVLTSTPSVMMSLTIAMTIDYCLFILTRFRQELMLSDIDDVEERLADAMAIAIETGGWAVLLSGSILATSFLVLACFPMPGWQTYGVGGAVAMIVQVIVHLTVLPAYVQHMPDFFARCAPSPQEIREDPSLQTLDPSTGLLKKEDWVLGLWRRIASLSAEPWRGAVVIFALTAFTVGLGYRFPDMKLSGEMELFIPQNTDAWDGYHLMAQQFGKGPINPMQLIMTVDKNKYDSFLAKEPWQDSQLVLKTLVENMPHTKGIRVSAMSWEYQDGEAVATPWSRVADCVEVANTNSSCDGVRGGLDGFISKDKEAQLVTITLGFDPSTDPGQDFTKRARDLLEKFQKTTVLKFGLAGGGAEMADICSKINDLFPYIVASTFTLALIILATSFHSLVYPITCVITILLTIMFTYGLGVRIYQDSFLEWTGIQSLRNRFNAFPYGSPMGLFSIIVGLCLDYDIFLMSCITELRASGMTPKEAVVEGLVRSGGIITAAGTIMSLAFAGLMFTTTVYGVHISGYFLTCAVLYDTFVIRSFFVPAAAIMLDRFNWWPSDLSKADYQSAGAPVQS